MTLVALFQFGFTNSSNIPCFLMEKADKEEKCGTTIINSLHMSDITTVYVVKVLSHGHVIVARLNWGVWLIAPQLMSCNYFFGP